MGEAKRKRREATIEDLMAAQVAPVISQDGIPSNLNVFATMDAAWQDFVGKWVHLGLPDKYLPDVKLTFYSGVQAANNLLVYCAGQGMFDSAADQLQADIVGYEKELEGIIAERKANEWRTGEI